MSVDSVQVWTSLQRQIKTSLSFVMDDADEVVVKMVASVVVKGIQDIALQQNKVRWQADDVDKYIKAFWENIGNIPRLFRLREEVTKAMVQELKQILQERN